MNDTQPTGLQLAISLLAQIGDDDSDRAIAAVHAAADERDELRAKYDELLVALHGIGAALGIQEGDRSPYSVTCGVLERVNRLAEIEAQEPVIVEAGELRIGFGDTEEAVWLKLSRNIPLGTELFTRPAPAQAVPDVPNAACDVLAERRRQVSAEGYDHQHDDAHVCDEIAAAACFYAMPPGAREWDTSSTGYGDTLGDAIVPDGWVLSAGSRRRDLVKAGALILAEIERMDRAARAEEPEPGIDNITNCPKCCAYHVPAQAVPAGWRLVPVEPTIAMCIAGDSPRMLVDDCTPTPAIYRAMIAAAPEAAR